MAVGARGGTRVTVGGSRRSSLGSWLLAGFAICVLAALGRHAPVFPLLLELPLVGLFRYPAKAMLPASLLWSLLVGLGFATWQRDWHSSRRPLVVAGLALFLGVAGLLAARRVDAAFEAAGVRPDTVVAFVHPEQWLTLFGHLHPVG